MWATHHADRLAGPIVLQECCDDFQPVWLGTTILEGYQQTSTRMPPTDSPADAGPSRRTVLRAAGATLVAGATSLAGCMSTLPPLGRRVRFGRVDAPPRDQAVYARWLPPASALEGSHDDLPAPIQQTMVTTPGRLGVDDVGLNFTLGASIMRSQLDYLGMGFDRYDWAMSPPGGLVLAGDIDRTQVHETLTGTVYEPQGTHLDFDLYRRADRPAVAAVSGTHVVFDAGDGAGSNVRTLIDTGRGRADRYVDVDEAAGRLVSRVGASPFTWFGAPTFTIEQNETTMDPRATAFSYDFADGNAFFSYDLLFSPDAIPDRPTIRTALETNDDAVRSAGVDVSIDDPFVRVEMRFDPADLRAANADPLVTPQITWTSAYDPATERLTLTHHAGDPVNASSLTLTADAQLPDDRLSPRRGQIGPGETLSIDLSGVNGTRVQVVLDDPDGDSAVTIYTYDRTTDASAGGEDDAGGT